MEIENEIKENNDITATQLYEKLESWNKDIEKSFNEGKKGKKSYYKLKDLLIKFNKFPTPIKDVELIDIKLGNKIIEDDLFLEKDFLFQHIRRGESLFYNKAEDIYDYARLGLPKFFDYKKSYNDSQKDNKLKNRVLGKILEIAENEKNNENVRYFAYLTTKVNGENFQVSYNTKYNCWIIASKNVSLAIRNKEDIEFYKNENNFKNYVIDGNDQQNKLISDKDKKKMEKKEKKKEKKKKKQERIERRKKGKNEEDEKDENEEEEKEEKDENAQNKININIENKNDKKNKTLKNLLERYTFALDFAETWLNLLEKKIINNENKNLIDEFKTELGNHTLIGESVGDKKREHILVYKERDIIFYGIVNNQKLLSQNCLTLSKSFDLFKKYNLSFTEISPSKKYNKLEELFIYLNEQYDVIFDKSLQESGEGNVVYLSCDINKNESIKGLAKLKTFEYRFLRKVREKCKAVPPKVDRVKIELDYKNKFNENKKKKEKKKKGKKEVNENEEKEALKKMYKKIDNEEKEKNEERDKKLKNLINKMIRETNDLLKEVPKSKYNLDSVLLNEYLGFGEYIINYKAKDDTNYSDVFASYIEVMKEKYKTKAEINDLLISEIKKKFEGLISNKEKEEEENKDKENKDDEKDEEDQKE